MPFNGGHLFFALVNAAQVRTIVCTDFNNIVFLMNRGTCIVIPEEMVTGLRTLPAGITS
jgi:hypothetical protein